MTYAFATDAGEVKEARKGKSGPSSEEARNTTETNNICVEIGDKKTSSKGRGIQAGEREDGGARERGRRRERRR